MSAGDRDTLADLLAAHDDYFDCWNQCRNSGLPAIEDSTPLEAESAHRAHVADVIASSDWLREHDRATYAHGYHHGYKDAAYDHDAAVYGDQDEYLRDRAERAAANEYRTTEDH